MSNKKFPKLAVLSLLGILSLTACDSSSEIKSQPSNYNDPIVTFGDEKSDEDVHNDILSIIADQIHDDSLASKTLDKVMYRYAQSVFGSYNAITKSDNDESITLKAAAADNRLGSDYAVINAFIKAHKAYWTYDDDGKHVDDNDNEVDDETFTPSNSERERVSSRFKDIEGRIASNMYGRIKTGSYTSKHFFYEVKYLKALHEDGQDVAHYKTVEAMEDPESTTDPKEKLINPIIIDYTVEEDEIFDKEILHREFYQTNYELNKDETTPDASGNEFHYIEKEIIPEIYNDLLIEQYLLDEELAAVKNSRARQINVIKIEKYSDFQINADLLVKELVKDIYATVPEATSDYIAYVDEENNPFEKMFKIYENISKGLYKVVNDDEDPDYSEYQRIIGNIHSTRSDAFQTKTGTNSTYKYYANTTYGDLVEDYEELLSAESYDEIDTSLRNKFTSNGTCTFEEGFDQETISLSQVETITKGWYVQKSAPSLDSNGKIQDTLFQLSVANKKLEIKDQNDTEDLAELMKTDRIVKNATTGEWEPREKPVTEGEYKENKYLCSINGAYFLKFEGSYSGSDYKNNIVYDDGSAYYIVQVLEAVKEPKLKNASYDSSYAKTRSPEFLNKVLSEVTRKVAETGNYASLAKEHWLEKMDIKYHDQSVYDYFKDNYPDLFD